MWFHRIVSESDSQSTPPGKQQMNAFRPDLSEKLRVAEELLTLRSLLELYRTRRSEYAWLWEIRLKAVDYLLKRYGLEPLIEPDVPDERKMAELKSSSPVLRIPASFEAPLDSEVTRRVKQRFRSLFEKETTREGSAAESGQVSAAGITDRGVGR